MRNDVSINGGGCSATAAVIVVILLVLVLPPAALGRVNDVYLSRLGHLPVCRPHGCARCRCRASSARFSWGDRGEAAVSSAPTAPHADARAVHRAAAGRCALDPPGDRRRRGRGEPEPGCALGRAFRAAAVLIPAGAAAGASPSFPAGAFGGAASAGHRVPTPEILDCRHLDHGELGPTWLLADDDAGQPDWRPGVAVTCSVGVLAMWAFFGPYPADGLVQFAVRTADGRVERHGPRDPWRARRRVPRSDGSAPGRRTPDARRRRGDGLVDLEWPLLDVDARGRCRVTGERVERPGRLGPRRRVVGRRLAVRVRAPLNLRLPGGPQRSDAVLPAGVQRAGFDQVAFHARREVLRVVAQP